MRIPGPDHPITIAPNSKRIIVTFAGKTIADTRHALTLRESTYQPVQYVPREDVDMALLERTQHATVCPYKGNASYFSLVAGGKRSENAAWSYETPHPAMAAIKKHLAFYRNRVDSIEERAV